MKSDSLKIFLALFVVVIWGINPAVAKLGMLEIPPFWFLSLRYLFTVLIFLPFAKVQREDWKVIFVYAIFANVLSNGAQFVAFQFLSPTASTLLLMTETPITVIMAAFFCHEKVSLPATCGIVLSMAGVVTVLGLPEIHIGAAILIILTRIAWGYCQLLFKNTSNLQAAAFISLTALIAFPFTLAAAVAAEPDGLQKIMAADWQIQGWIFLFQALMLSLAMVLWQKLIAWFGVSQISPFAVLQIVFGILGGVVFFSDRLNGNTVLGIILISSGVLLTNQSSQKKCKPERNNDS